MLFDLFLSFCKIGALSFGGGMAALPLIQAEIVEKQGWLSIQEFTDLISIAEMTPGPIAINSASFVGTKIAGVLGTIVATMGCVFPSIIIVGFMGFLYFRFRKLTFMQSILRALRPAIVALIASAGFSIMSMSFVTEGAVNWIAIVLFALVLFILRWKKTPPVFTLIASGILGGGVYLLQYFLF